MVHAKRRPALLLRAQLRSAIRSWFDQEGFIEADTGCLQASPGNETHLHAFRTDLIAPDLLSKTVYLHTSPELAMKKLLAAGEPRIYSLGSVFRNRERGALHHPEFTMLEWYRARVPYEDLFHDCASLLALAAQASKHALVSFRGRTCDMKANPQRLTVSEAFGRFAGTDLLSTITAAGGDRDALAQQAAGQGIDVGEDYTWSDIFSRILVERIENKLGIGQPTLLTDYPIPEAALARPSPRDPRVAERFELYVCGVELANGYGELADETEQRRRFEQSMAEKLRVYGERYPIDEDFLSALAAMPPAAGCALGFDRLLMLAAGAEHIDDVIWTPL